MKGVGWSVLSVKATERKTILTFIVKPVKNFRHLTTMQTVGIGIFKVCPSLTKIKKNNVTMLLHHRCTFQHSEIVR